MFGLRMFTSMLMIDGAVLFVLYALISILGSERGGIVSFLPAALMVSAGIVVRPRARRSRIVSEPRSERMTGRYR